MRLWSNLEAVAGPVQPANDANSMALRRHVDRGSMSETEIYHQLSEARLLKRVRPVNSVGYASLEDLG